MTKEGYLKHKKLIEAWANGEEIEYYTYLSGKWEQASIPSWYLDVEYRIKPKPEYVPFDFSDAEMVVGKVIKNNSNTLKFLVYGAENEGVLIDNRSLCYKALLNNYKFLDGSPCGKLKQ